MFARQHPSRGESHAAFSHAVLLAHASIESAAPVLQGLQGCMKISALPKIAVCDTLSRAARVWSRSCAAWVSMRAGVDYKFDWSGVASLQLPANFPESHVDPAPGGSSFPL
jgi:hypothetical protein